jgi:DNA-binding transcriptional regulator YhcF (GntR family)
MISDGALKPGDKLPTEMELGAKFKTGRLNAHYAVKSLEEAGLLTRNKRGGTTVKSIPSTFTLGQLKSETSDSVCVLNQYADTISSIHWNEKLIAPLERILKEHGLELKYRSICDIREPAVYKRLLEDTGFQTAARR